MISSRSLLLLSVSLFLGCLHFSSSVSALEDVSEGSQDGAWRLGATTGAVLGRGRRLLFDNSELAQMESLRAAEDHALAVMDGKSKPLFSEKLLFDSDPLPTLFGASSGGAPLLQQNHHEQQKTPAGAAGKQVVGSKHGDSSSDADSSSAPRAPTAVELSMLRDGVPWEEGEVVPDAELQYKDEEGGGQVLIWLPQDTLPRDMLVGKKRPQVWVYCVIDADYGAAALLSHFLDHYLKLGIRPNNMLFVVNHNPALAGVPPGALPNTTAMLDSYGLDYRVWMGERGEEEALLKRQLQVLQRIPLRDWVILADLDELQEFGGLTAPQFFAERDAEGTNWVRGFSVDRVSPSGSLSAVNSAPSLFKQFPLECDLSRKVAHAEGNKVAAFRGFLRPGPPGHDVLSMTEARQYFGAASPDAGMGTPSRWRGGVCGGGKAVEDLLPLTPYSRYRQFYRAADVTGNVYLWDAREAQPKVRVNRFPWREGVERLVADTLQCYREESEACGKAVEEAQRPPGWQQAQRVMDTIITKGAIDVTNPYLMCQVAEDPKMPAP